MSGKRAPETSAKTALVWLRRDLRLGDNPALQAAIDTGGQVFAVYVLDDKRQFSPGGAQKWFLHHALQSLGENLKPLGAPLILRRGDAGKIIPTLATEIGAGSVFWNRRYAEDEIATDKKVKAVLKNAGIETASFNGALLAEPWEIETKSGGPYRVYTPYWNTLREQGPTRREYPTPTQKPKTSPPRVPSDNLGDWDLLPTNPDWASAFGEVWTPSEKEALHQLDDFLDGVINTYGEDRNRPDKRGTSRLSPFLALGLISPLTIWNKVRAAMDQSGVSDSEAWKFLSEVAWREFSYHLLYHNPKIPTEPFREEFRSFNWRSDKKALDAWRRGMTGVPFVDAGMRELWSTGWMHNRVRMVAASFLVKNLLLHWREGERWFWETLVDADPANNVASWQWVAGSGADAAPYFRIFNPVTQGEKFDPKGDYVRRWIPEIANLPDKHLHDPSSAPQKILEAAGITLGKTYPKSIVDLGETRKRALARYDAMRNE
ncbi:MAG: deoxyribodipyrimidine photo-lyase [Parvularculaceae bacterium]